MSLRTLGFGAILLAAVFLAVAILGGATADSPRAEATFAFGQAEAGLSRAEGSLAVERPR